MSRIGSLFVFVGIVTGTYFLMNWYVLGRLAYVFGIKKSVGFYVVVTALAFSLLASITLDTRVGNWLTALILRATTTWLGVCFLFFWCLIVLQIIGWVVQIPPPTAAMAAIGIVTGLTIYSMINAPRINVRKLEIAAPLDLRIAQISDVHIGSTGGGFFSRVVDEVGELKPDLVLITGDMIDNDKASTAEALEHLNRLSAPVFFVSGNHERYVGYDNVRRLLAATNVRWLRNEAVTLDKVRIIGIDDNVTADKMDEALVRAGDNAEAYTILMYHRPEWFGIASKRNVNLMLAGHTHHGQIWPFNFVVGSIYRYIGGVHEIGQMQACVSNGTGTWGPRMRLGSHSEIVLIDLRPAQ
jgi:predicted MPP superfamily phosphohydrolase